MNLGKELLSLFTSKDRALRYKHILTSDHLKRMIEYKMLTYLAEFQEKTNNEYFDFKEFQIFLDAKTIEEDDIVSTVLTDGFIECLKNPVVITEETEKVIIDILTKQAFIDDVDNLIKNNVNSSKIFDGILNRVNRVQNELIKKNCAEEIEPNIEELLENDENDVGLIFPFKCLRDTMRPLQEGDFGIVAARPDAGKTSLLSCFASAFASQLPEDAPVLWLNNEGLSERIWLRLYQSVLQCTTKELLLYKNAGRLQEVFTKRTGGGRKQIKIYSIHDMDSAGIENLIKRINPGVVIYDMIDNIKFSGSQLNAGQRTDQVLEEMYKWARNLAVIHRHVGIASSQISADGENEHFPGMHKLKDSKTGKQGASDFIMMLGRDAELTNMRYISLPKNKLAKSGKKDPRAELHFDGSRGTFYEEYVDENKRKAIALQHLD